MKLLDRLAGRLGYAPVRPPKPPKRRAFDAGSVDRLTNDWDILTTSPDSELRRDLRKMRARSRDLAINNEYAGKFLSMLKCNVIGSHGIPLKMKVKTARGDALDENANKIIEEHWDIWGRKENCTVAGDISWTEVQNLILETTARDGEVLARKIFPWKGNAYQFALQPLESDQLDIELNVSKVGNTYAGIYPQGRIMEGHTLRMGIERDEWGKRVAYWLLRQNPSDVFYLASLDFRWQRIPAEEMIHLYLQRRIYQTRGYPWFASVMTRVNMLGGYEEAELTAARASACKMGFIQRDYPDAPLPQDGDDGTGNRIQETQPGMIEDLGMGAKFVTHDPQHPNAAYGDFVKACLRGIAAGLNVSYNTLSNDLEGVNFSSGRLGLADERDYAKLLQRWYSEHFCQDVFNAWLEAGLVSGEIPLRIQDLERYKAGATWHGRRWQWVDPVKEVNAKIAEVNAGFTSISEVLAEQNKDRDDVFEQIADDKAAAEALGIEFAEVMKPPADSSSKIVDGEDSGGGSAPGARRLVLNGE